MMTKYKRTIEQIQQLVTQKVVPGVSYVILISKTAILRYLVMQNLSRRQLNCGKMQSMMWPH